MIQDVYVVRVDATTPFAALCANIEDADRLKALQESWGYTATVERFRGAVIIDASDRDCLEIHMRITKAPADNDSAKPKEERCDKT